MAKAKVLVFSSGTATAGGSGFRNLVEQSRTGQLGCAEIVGVVSNRLEGGVRKHAAALGVQYFFQEQPTAADDYRKLMSIAGAEWAVLSGWNKKVSGLDPRRTVNVHPAPLPRFGGKGMHGINVHRAVVAAFNRGEIDRTAVCMHFVTEEYDRGPLFFRFPIALRAGERPEDLQDRVKAFEHAWQPYILSLVIRGKISWDGVDALSLTLPPGYNCF